MLAAVLLLVASEAVPDPSTYASEHREQHYRALRVAEERQTDDWLEAAFQEYLVCPQGDTLMSFHPDIADEARLQRAVARRVARGWNASLLYVAIKGGALALGKNLCRSRALLNASARCTLGFYREKHHDLHVDTRGLVYPCRTVWHGWGMIAEPYCVPLDRDKEVVLLVVRFSLGDDEEVDYQRQYAEREQVHREREQAQSDAFLYQFFDEKLVSPRGETYISTYNWPTAPLYCVYSVEKMREAGWNIRVLRHPVHGRTGGGHRLDAAALPHLNATLLSRQEDGKVVNAILVGDAPDGYLNLIHVSLSADAPRL
jgi:hypothetical protein